MPNWIGKSTIASLNSTLAASARVSSLAAAIAAEHGVFLRELQSMTEGRTLAPAPVDWCDIAVAASSSSQALPADLGKDESAVAVGPAPKLALRIDRHGSGSSRQSLLV